VDYRPQFFVDPRRKLHLNKIDTRFSGEHHSEEDAARDTQRYHAKLGDLQAVLSASRHHSVLIILQALDAGGKDGTIKHVFSALNPQGVSVASFKTPTPVELEHDFLWRVHPHAPRRGEMAIFNRSHYEDVLVTRVHKLIDKPTWRERYKLIRAFERGLIAANTVVLKFFLHISPEEQLARFEKRLEDPTRNWKISLADYAEREFWDAYTVAYEDALTRTSSSDAPWYVIPADHKWFRNLAVSQIVADTLDELHLSYPPPSVDLEEIRRRFHQAAQHPVAVQGR
jgi:PPK2 family polyphosphate:nucleotide phosphotransferase